jgi:hypothetical protein
LGRSVLQTAERMTIVRAVAAVLRGRGYQAVMGEGDAQMLNILGKGGRLLGAATQSGIFRHAPGLTGEALAQVERDVADAHQIVRAIILDEAQKRGPKVSEEMMLAVWQRARAQEPAPKATASAGSVDPRRPAWASCSDAGATTRRRSGPRRWSAARRWSVPVVFRPRPHGRRPSRTWPRTWTTTARRSGGTKPLTLEGSRARERLRGRPERAQGPGASAQEVRLFRAPGRGGDRGRQGLVAHRRPRAPGR